LRNGVADRGLQASSFKQEKKERHGLRVHRHARRDGPGTRCWVSREPRAHRDLGFGATSLRVPPTPIHLRRPGSLRISARVCWRCSARRLTPALQTQIPLRPRHLALGEAEEAAGLMAGRSAYPYRCLGGPALSGLVVAFVPAGAISTLQPPPSPHRRHRHGLERHPIAAAVVIAGHSSPLLSGGIAVFLGTLVGTPDHWVNLTSPRPTRDVLSAA